MQGEPLEIYGDGSATRDYIYVDDLTAAINRAAFVSGIGGEVFQIATSRETTVSEVTEQLLCALAKHGMTQVKVIHASPRPGDMPRNYSDTRKARQRLGWQAQVTLAEGLERTVAWFVGGESSQVLAAKARGIADARRP
jgi:UDP-glucose 4-epimerase